MEVTGQVDLFAEKWVLRVSKGLFCAATLLSLALCFLFVAGHSPIEKIEVALPNISLSSLGQGPLALARTNTSKEVGSILQELVLIGASTRPDHDHDRECSLALRSSGDKRTLHVGEELFFKVTEGVTSFSEEATDLSMKALSLDNNLLVCEVKCSGASEACTLSSSAIFSQILEHESYIDVLKQGTVWGKDVFLTGWGGDEYREMTNKVKVSIGPDVYYLKPGDLLWWNGQNWAQEFQSDEMGPIAQVIKASSSGADLQVWDSTGFSSQTVHLSHGTPPKTMLKMDELMTAIRPRSSSEITCQLGKRRVIVREGDWWIRSEDRWRPVRTASDLEACLYHQIPGELFIFETVEASHGNVTLKGRVFDKMRTSSETVSLVLQNDKKPSIRSKPLTGSPQIAKGRSHRSLPRTANSQNEKEGL